MISSSFLSSTQPDGIEYGVVVKLAKQTEIPSSDCK